MIGLMEKWISAGDMSVSSAFSVSSASSRITCPFWAISEMSVLGDPWSSHPPDKTKQLFLKAGRLFFPTPHNVVQT